MAGTTTIQALPYPTATDAPDSPAQTLALAQAVEKKLVMIFASSADRTSKLGAPTEGMLSWLQDVNRFEYYSGSAWVPIIETESWQNLTLPSGYSAAGGAFGVPQFRKAGPNRVVFRGACNVAASNAAGTKFTLPAGYRPSTNTQACFAMMSNGTSVTGQLRYDVGTSGNMNTLTASPAATTFISFEQMSFSLD